MGTDGGAGSDRGEAAILTTHNTFTKRKEPFAPLEEGTARLYVCGPNLYGPVHVGHAFSYAFFDVVRRYLEYRGYRVIHVQNFTDIEDRIIERAPLRTAVVVEMARDGARGRPSGFWRGTEFYRVERIVETRREHDAIYYRVITDHGCFDLRRYRALEPWTLRPSVWWELTAELEAIEVKRPF